MNNSLKRARKEQELTQGEVAGKAGIHRTAYTRIERGERTPNVYVALKLASILGKPVEQLFCEEKNRKV